LLAQADRAGAGDLVDIGQANRSSWRSAVSDTGSDEWPPASPPPEGTFASEQMSAAMHANDPATVRRLIEAGEPIDASDVGMLRTPLLWAAEYGHTDLVRFLLDRGADIEDRADEGESPLMLAAFGGHRDAVQVLLERGADPDYVTDKGWDAVMFAELGKHDGVAALIKEAQGHHGPLHEDERTSDI
jgi:ankyrin repeat protein